MHLLRQDYSSIMVGINTVLQDNPALTVRKKGKIKNPIRIIVDSHLRTPLNAQVLQEGSKVYIAHTQAFTEQNPYSHLKHIELISCPAKEERVDLQYLFKILGEKEIDSIFVEGGAELHFSILKHQLAHKLYAFIAPLIIGGKESKSSFGGQGFAHLSDAVRLKRWTYKKINNDLLIEGYLSCSQD